jgi:hypothetical protein
MKDGIPYRNHSPNGWWIASYIERMAWDCEPNPSPNSRCTAWENTIILKAGNREEAYEKAVKLAQNPSEFEDASGRKGHWFFEGLTSLLPIYSELEDGAEILWQEHENRTVGKVRSWVKSKEELEVFDDSPSPDVLNT